MNNVKLAYFDLDGTIIPESNLISDQIVKSMQYLKAKGIKVGICTGRSFYLSQYFLDKIKPNAPSILINGAWILDYDFLKKTRQNLAINTIDPLASSIVMETLRANQMDFIVYTDDGIYCTSEAFSFYQRILFYIRTNNVDTSKFKMKIVTDLDFYRKEKLLKILFIFPNKKGVDVLQKQVLTKFDAIKEVYYVVSERHTVDMCNGYVNKKTALEYVVNYYNYTPENLAFFGDNTNDVCGFQYAKHSVCLANGPIRVQKTARYVTDLDCDHDGVADFIFKNF